MSDIDPAALKRQPDILTLFKLRQAVNEEIQNRAWEVLKELGYDWYKQTSMAVSYVMRGKVVIVSINARFERNHQNESADHELPLTLFNTMYSRDAG